VLPLGVAAVLATTVAGVSAATKDSTAAKAPSAVASVDWPTLGGSLTDDRYSTASQITTKNVAQLKVAFAAPLDIQGAPGSGSEYEPIVQKGVLYGESGNGTLGAYDAATGKALWHVTPQQLGLKIGQGPRGIAIAEGKIFVTEPGGTLFAISMKTHKPIWHTLINTQHVTGYSLQAPIYANGRLFIGQSGSDIVGGMRGFMKSLSASTGEVLWTFDSLPKAGTAAAKTWGSPKELTDGGGAHWTNVAVDPQTNTVFVPTGNPWPDFGRGPGDELYTDGLAAMDATTGRLKWFYQTTHHDEWDYDCAQPPTLWEQTINGKDVKGVSVACKNGYAYELNRATGKPVTPVKEVPLANAKSDPAAKKLDETKFKWLRTGGKPLTEPVPVGGGAVTPVCASKALLPKTAPDGKPYEISCGFNYYSDTHFTAGTVESAVDWQPASLNPKVGYAFYCTNNGIRSVKIQNVKAKQTSDIQVWPQLFANGNGGSEPNLGDFVAMNLQNDKQAWKQHYAKTTCAGGSATTAGGLVFNPDGSGTVHAYDAKTGKQLWSYTNHNLAFAAPPIVYSVKGREYVALNATANGHAVELAFALSRPSGASVAALKPAPFNPKDVNVKVGAATFAQACGYCHTLAAAKTTGQIGPNLDDVHPSRATVVTRVTNGGERMPSFAATLTSAQIQSVARYVAAVAGKKK
jgi:quinohemoprotein ethanol dehydrogenase